MVNMLDKMTNIVLIGGLLIILALVIFIAFYFINKNNTKGKAVNDEPTTLLKREDSTSYVPMDTIKDDMIVTDNGYRFIGMIRCSGFDFYTSNASEQAGTMGGYLGFIKSIDNKITYRQFFRTVDMSHTIKMYKEAQDRINSELFNATEDFKQVEEEFKKVKNIDIEKAERLLDELERLKKKTESLAWREYHMRDQIAYIGRISGKNSEPEAIETYVYEWVYDAREFAKPLTKEEIYTKALVELDAKTRNMIIALSKCNVKAYRLNTSEIIEICRAYYKPISAEQFKMADIENSSFYEDIITSDSMEELNASAIQEFVETQIDMNIDEIEKNSELFMNLQETLTMSNKGGN